MISYLRFLKRNKLYTAVEIIGMAIAIAFVVFIGTFVIGDYNTDLAIKKQGDIFVGRTDGFFLHTYPTKDILSGEFPEVKDMCRMMDATALRGVTMRMIVGEHTETQKALIVDQNFLEFFPVSLLEGNSSEALSGNKILLSSSCALRLFPNENALGKNIRLKIDSKEKEMMVSGIYEDFKNTILPTPDIIYNFNCIQEISPVLIHSGNGTVTLFFRLMDGTSIKVLEEKMEKILKKEELFFKEGLANHYYLDRFEDIPKLEDIQLFTPFQNIVSPVFIQIFIGIGILLFLFSIFNYISLTVAQSGFRAKEMASRRLLGSSQSSIIMRYLAEALVLTLLSFILALILVKFATPYFNELVNRQQSPFAKEFWYSEVFFMLTVILLLSFCAGIIPAALISRYQPIDIVKGNFAHTSKMTLGRILIIIQSIIASITLALAIVMAVQLKYMEEKPMGYEKDHIIWVFAHSYEEYRTEELNNLACVDKIGFIQQLPMGQSVTAMTLSKKGETYKMNAFYGDSNAFDILGFKVLSKMKTPVDDDIWLTETAMKAFNLTVDSLVTHAKYGQFCGVIEDYHQGTASAPEKSDLPKVFYLLDMKGGKNYSLLRYMIVKVKGDEDEALQAIRDFYYQDKNIEVNSIKLNTFNRLNSELYNKETQNLKLIIAFGFIVILLTALALFAISTYYARQHAKSVALRKIMGCNRPQLFIQTSFRFLKLIGIALIIAMPLAYWITGEWLEGYNYRIDNAFYYYLVVILIMLVVAVLSIGWQMVRLMNTNPVEVLKTE